MRVAYVYAWCLAAMAAWGIFAARKTYLTERDWSRRRSYAALVECLFVAGCLGCAAALWTGRFRPWMAGTIAVSYALMIPMRCYFETVDRLRGVRIARNLLFVAVALFLLAIAVGVVPPSFLGLP